MDVKVINEHMAFNFKHFRINFKSKTYMYEVDVHSQPPQSSLPLSLIHFDESWNLFWLRHMKLLKERVQSISEQFLQFCPEKFNLTKKQKL